MGWTEYSATKFYNNGQINRKAECDSYFEEGLNRGWYEIVKSTLKGSIYYAAIKRIKRYVKNPDGTLKKDSLGKEIVEEIPEKEREVVGVVMRTGTRDGRWFAYKDMSETMGPCYYDCPNSILDLLTPTTNAYALSWRDACRKKNSKPSISKLPIGTVIKFKNYNGDEVVLEKHSPAYQFKTPFWMIVDSSRTIRYYSKKRIPDNFDIVKE